MNFEKMQRPDVEMMHAAAFNRDLSNWDVSRVTDMKAMFASAKGFRQKLCGTEWVNSKAIRVAMFEGSPGSIPRTVCRPTHIERELKARIIIPPSSFSPQSKSKLKGAVRACLKLSVKGDCSKSLHGPIGNWVVSGVTDMSQMFLRATFFLGDISKWDVSGAKDMSGMFNQAALFNGELSKWDVSSVIDMIDMFSQAPSFNTDISKWDV